MGAGFSFCRTRGRTTCFKGGERAAALLGYTRREGERTDGCTKAKAELTTDSRSLRAFGRRTFTLVLYIGGTEALYIEVGGVLTSYLYIGEGGEGISKNIFFISTRDSSI